MRSSEVEQTAGSAYRVPERPLFVVVGFDGTEAAQRALDRAVDLVRDRDGGLEIVYVAHQEVENAFDDQERRLALEVRSRLASSEPRWHFQRRVGDVAPELIAVADALRREHGPDASIVVAVGASSHGRHCVAGSLALDFGRVDRFGVVVVL